MTAVTWLLHWVVPNAVCALVTTMAAVLVGLVAIPIGVIAFTGTNIITVDAYYESRRVTADRVNGATGIVVAHNGEETAQ